MWAERRCVAVDLISAGPASLRLSIHELVRELVNASPVWRFVLFASRNTAAEWETFSAPNARLVQMQDAPPIALPAGPQAVARAGALAWQAWLRFAGARELRKYGCSLVLAPFTVSSLPRRAIAFVPLVNESAPSRALQAAVASASAIVCTSETVRTRVVEMYPLARRRACTIPLRSWPAAAVDDARIARLRCGLELDEQPLVMCPTDAGRNANHELLLTAFGIFRGQHPDSRLVLVYVGVESRAAARLRVAAERFGLDRHVRVVNSPDEADVLLTASMAAIVPSLSDAFLPWLRAAVALGKPVLSSRQSMGAELGGASEARFDGRRPVEVANALGLLETDYSALKASADNARRHLQNASDEVPMSVHYQSLFESL